MLAIIRSSGLVVCKEEQETRSTPRRELAVVSLQLKASEADCKKHLEGFAALGVKLEEAEIVGMRDGRATYAMTSRCALVATAGQWAISAGHCTAINTLSGDVSPLVATLRAALARDGRVRLWGEGGAADAQDGAS